MVLASPYFNNYYNLEEHKYIIVNNKPSRVNKFQCNSEKVFDELKEKLGQSKVIGFVGTVRYPEILLNLIFSIKQSDADFKLLIAGDGPALDGIKSYVLEKELGHKVFFSGRYETKNLREIYGMCDYIWAAYPNKDLNVKYAVSNKFFESQVFEKPIIVSENTCLGDFVVENSIGMIVNPYSVNSITNVLNEISFEKFQYENMISNYWEDEEDFYKKIYF